MKNIILLLVLILSTLYLSNSQENKTLSGYIKDKSTGETLIGASISVVELKTGAYSNAYGFYSISIPKGTYTIQISYVGYENFSQQVTLNDSRKIDFEITSSSLGTDEIIVTAEKEDRNIKTIEMSSIAVNTEVIKKMPALLGEVDVIRSIQLLPGVSTVGEGATGFNVRGGSIDQNLVLLDEAPVYNSSHLFGFFSVFNPDAVKDVKLIKGGIGSEYGGRLSSILDVRLKEGNSRNYNIDGGVGAIFSRFAVEGPIVNDKVSFLIAGRRSYIDFLAKPFLPDNLDGSQFYFYDLTAKANWKIDDKNTVFVSGYFGRDVFGAGFIFNWGSQTGTIRWNHLFSDKLFSNLTYYYSNYDYVLGFGNDDQDRFDWNSNIVTQSLKNDFTYYYSTNSIINFGVEAIYYDFEPGNANGISGGISVPISLDHRYAGQLATYIGHEWNATDLLSFKYGVRASFFSYLGPGKYYDYGDTTLGQARPVLNTYQADSWENIADYFNLEPRFSMNYILSDVNSIKLSYNRMVQYLHLVSNTAAATPLDLWTPSTNNLQPQLADQYAIGYFQNFKDNLYETSVEVFYKDLQNQIEYRDGADPLLNEFLEGDFLFGKGRAYGAEFYIKKTKGDFNGWISYTLSRSERLIEGINNFDWFPARFDRTHVLNLVAFYKLTKKWEFSTNFTYTTGTPATFPTNGFFFQGKYVPHNAFGLRNGNRIPAYHRLDLSATYKPFNKPDDWWKGEWVFSLYNVYNRRNAFSVFPELNAQGIPQATQLSIIGSIVPSVSYNFNFDVQNLGKK